MNYINKLVSTLKKHNISKEQFYTILDKNDTFFDNYDLETELIVSNGFPLYFTDNKVGLKTATTHISEQTFCIVDIETSAPNTKQGQLIEIGAVKYKNGTIIETYNSLVNTDKIPPIVEEITGISASMTHSAPNIQTVLEEFKIFLEDDIFVAHAIDFDYKFLNDSFKKYNLGNLCNRRLCTIELSKKLIDTQKYGLKALCELLDIDISGHHRALADASATLEIFQYCISILPHNITTTEELIDFTKKGKKYESI